MSDEVLTADGREAVNERGFHHHALFYHGDDGFLEAVIPFVEGALQADEPMLVAVASDKLELLRSAVGDASRVLFVDMRVLGSNPARIIPAWRRFVDEHGAGDRPVRGVGEPAWPGRSQEELVECQRHEALLNIAFGGGQPWQLMCPYDLDALDDDVVRAARQSHPFVVEEGTGQISGAYCGDGGWRALEGVLSEPGSHPVEMEFTCEELTSVRRSVATFATDARLATARVDDLVLAVNELACNSVYHGGGLGRLRIWRDRDTVVCEVGDRGRIVDPLVGRVRPAASDWSGRGLWLVNQLCDLAQIRSNAAGTVVRLHMAVS